MTAIDEPASQLSSAAAGADRPSDDLEHWLSDLRTEVTADPSGWINEDPGSEHPTDEAAERSPLPHGRPGTGASEPGSAGRHRAPE
jgi:hypothetical protein